MKIYFAGSIAGGRESLQDYQMISRCLRDWGEVLPRAVSDQEVDLGGENLGAEEIFSEQLGQINDCDAFLLEGTCPSFGSPIPCEAYSEEHDLRQTLGMFFG